MMQMRLVSQNGSKGERPAVFLSIESVYLDVSQTQDGDGWLAMSSDEAHLNARFRNPSGGGGRSPFTLLALRGIIDASQDCPVDQVILPWLSHDFTASRTDEELGIELTTRFTDNILTLSLKDCFGRQEERGALVAVAIPLAVCPPELQQALWSLPYAMLRDNGQTIATDGVIRPAQRESRPPLGYSPDR